MRQALTMLALLCACGDDGAPNYPDAAQVADANLTVDVAPARETIMEVQTLQPGEIVEGIMTGGASDLALIHLATTKLDWNIHSHATGSSITLIEERGKATVDYSFVPPQDGEWFLLIKNSNNVTEDVDVRVGLYGGMQWRWQ